MCSRMYGFVTAVEYILVRVIDCTVSPLFDESKLFHAIDSQ